MRKISFFTLLAFLLLGVFTGCLKDEGFENQEYGIQIPGGSGISLAEAPKSPILKALNAVATPQTIVTAVHLEGDKPASQDIHVTLALNPALATTAGFTAVPTTAFNVPLAVTIPAGKMLAEVVITIPNASTLNPNNTYGIGLVISSVDPGYTIAANFKQLVVAFSLKNKYDGVYRLRARIGPATDRPTVNTATSFLWPGDVHLVTSGANSVNLYDAWGFLTNIQPIQTNTFANSGFGSTDPRFVFDPATDKLTAVVNDFPNPTNGRAFMIDPAITTSRYDPATKTVYAAFIMTQPGFLPLPIKDTFVFVKAR